MTKIIGLVQIKGRAGWSNVSTNLAGKLSKLENYHAQKNNLFRD